MIDEKIIEQLINKYFEQKNILVNHQIESYNDLKKEYNLEDHEICFIGDDIIDIPIFKKVGLAISVPNAPDYVIKHTHYTTTKAGGEGAVREVIDLLIESRGDFDGSINKLLSDLR